MTQQIRAMMGGAVPPPTRQPPTQNIRPAFHQNIQNPVANQGMQQFSMAQMDPSLFLPGLAMGQHQAANVFRGDSLPVSQVQQISRPRQRKASKNSLEKVNKKSRKNPKNSLGYKLAKLSETQSSTHSPSPQLPLISTPSSTHLSVSGSQIHSTASSNNSLATHASVASLQNPITTLATQAYLRQRQILLQSALLSNTQTISNLLPNYNPFHSVQNPLATSCPNVLPSTLFTRSQFPLPLTNNKFKP